MGRWIGRLHYTTTLHTTKVAAVSIIITFTIIQNETTVRPTISKRKIHIQAQQKHHHCTSTSHSLLLLLLLLEAAPH